MTSTTRRASTSPQERKVDAVSGKNEDYNNSESTLTMSREVAVNNDAAGAVDESDTVGSALKDTFSRRPNRVKRSTNAILKRTRSMTRNTMALQGPESNNIENFVVHPKSPQLKKTRSRTRQYVIRPMQMKDVSAVYKLGNSIFTASEFPNMYRTWDDFAVVANFAGSSEFCFVVLGGKNSGEDEDEIIGFLLGDSMTKSKVGTRGYIQWVAVAQPYRRLRIATTLLAKFCEVARTENISLLLADTPADNTPAIRLFENAGLQYKKEHVYLTKQLKDVETQHVDEDGWYDFQYTAKGHRIRIRPMEIGDLHPIHLIGENIFTSKSANLFHFWDETVVLHSYMSDPEYCVTAVTKEDDGSETVVGFAIGTTIEKPRSSWRYGYLVWLGCHREYQGLGIATQLYNTMVELFALEKVRMLMIDTQQNNVGALRFFRKVGFGHDEEHVYLSNAPMTESAINESSIKAADAARSKESHTG